MVARARKTHPQSSHDAAKLMNETIAQSQAERVRVFVEIYPGRTSWEISKGLEIDRHHVASRLADLKKQGKVRQDRNTRTCTVCKHKCVTWWPPRKKGELF